jgi:hypothetical protein
MLDFQSDIVPAELVAMEKFHVWWHYICCIGDHVVTLFDQSMFGAFTEYISASLLPRPSTFGKHSTLLIQAIKSCFATLSGVAEVSFKTLSMPTRSS